MSVTSVGVPAYFHPRREAADWARLRALGDRLGIVVVNPDTGPGAGDAAYRTAVRDLPGLVAGYVDTDYARRPLADVLADVAAYCRLHGIEAVFADQVTSSAEHLPYYARLAAAVDAALILNPGVRPDPGYLRLAAVVVTFEGPWSAHAALDTPDPPGLAATWHLVHGVPDGEEERTLARATALGATHAYATGAALPNPWGALPTWLGP
ncbi:spherulation-specific family 4 protein [Actinomycetospora succinea]|uniref:Spherulation-specific family 4 protein n=1 Tax=Actinomycetospora succinea TaxID=663603 RepID=A0A4R6VI74_9PSEU|nr:spherulation-specific family 4 protein [Actinomycetospora succinea]TDQ61036.1 spherulation-specific family 4 protein [Actinomycetospora succinea]